MTPVTYSPDETIRLLAERAKTGTDRFVVKVSRRRGMAGLLEHIATLTEATVNHIANPETWLPLLCGGGDYGLLVSHMDEVSARLGGVLTYKFQGAPLERVNLQALQRNDWNGPGQIIFPAATESGLPNGSAGATAQGPGVSSGYGMPPHLAPPGGNPAAVHPFAGTPFGPPLYDERTERERERLAREARELAESKAKSERLLAEREFEVREKEREAKLKEEVTARQRELEAKLVQQQQGQAGLKEVVAAIAPIAAALIQSSQQARLDQMRMQEESSRRFMEMMTAQQAQMQAIMLKMTESKGMDPSVTAMLEMMKTNSSGSAEMMTRIVDAMGTVSKTSVGMIEAIAELNLGGPSEHPLLGAVREGIRAMATLSQGATAGARKAVQAQTQPPQLPGSTQPKQQAPQQAKPTNGATGAQVVHEAPHPPPNHPPASEAPAAFGEAEPGKLEAPVEGKVIERLKELIVAHHDPAQVAEFFIVALMTTKEMQEALTKHNGDFGGLIGEHLGLWAMTDDANREYLAKLGAEAERIGIERGLFAGQDEEPEEEDAAE